MKLYSTVYAVLISVAFSSAPLQAQSGNTASNMIMESLPIDSVGAINEVPEAKLSIKDTRYVGAYHDVVHILSEKNSCSEFFGGPQAASLVFNQFAAGLGTTLISGEIGIYMTGDFAVVTNQKIGTRYRLFSKAQINVNGPFYREQTLSMHQSIGPVGNFAPNTREARALMLLHELGHLIGSSSKGWLLPDDGHDQEQSTKNTRTIEGYCDESIRRLHSK